MTLSLTAGESHTAGVKSDATAVAAGSNTYGQCNVGGLTGITQVAECVEHIVGLRADRRVAAVGRNDHGQFNVGGWMLR